MNLIILNQEGVGLMYKDNDWDCGICNKRKNGVRPCSRCIMPRLLDAVIGFETITENEFEPTWIETGTEEAEAA